MCHNISMEQIIREHFGTHVSVIEVTPLSGGDINRAYTLTLSSGKTVFIKANSLRNVDFFRAETEALSAIAATGTIQTPAIIGYGTDTTENNPLKTPCSFLLLEYLPPTEKNPKYWEHFGRALAELHRSFTQIYTPQGLYGFAHDNYIGATPQKNTPSHKWVDFFRDHRLKPQLHRAKNYLSSKDMDKAEILLNKLDTLLPEPDFPSLLHGDLWRGNVHTGYDGEAWLIDPASYVGHNEADIAMTMLFGSFPTSFYEAYREICSLPLDFKDRVPLYNLYHLLNHLNLFGIAYLEEVTDIVARYTGY